MIHCWVIAILFALAAGQSVRAQDSTGLLTNSFEPVRGGRLNVEVEACGGKLLITAVDFFQQIRKVPGGHQQVRTLFPARIQISASGVQEANYFAIPVDFGDGWFTQTQVWARLDQQTEVSIDPSSVDLGELPAKSAVSPDVLKKLEAAERFRRAAGFSPLSIRVVEEEETEPVIEIRLGALPLNPPPGLEIKHVENSKITETRTTRTPSQPKGEKPKVTTRTRDYEVPLAVHIGGAKGTGEPAHSNLLPPQLMFEDSEIRLAGTITGHRVLASGSTRQTSVARISPDTKGGFGDTEIAVNWRFALGEPPDVAWLESKDTDPETWMPELGGARQFVVRLKGPKQVKGVRFLLEQVSAYPGIAINASQAQLDSGARATITQIVPVKLSEGDTELRWSRTYQTYELGPADWSPDLYFDVESNPGCYLYGVIRSKGLPAPVADGLLVHQITNPVEATVSVMDWAASGVIRAEVLVDGFWEVIAAKGPGVCEDGTAIQFPLDKNRNSIADEFERGLTADADADALSWFEEYRGAYVSGVHQRFNPAREDYFLLDYASLLDDATYLALDQRFNPDEMDLHFIWPGEHSKETVGNRAGVFVFEALRQNALPAVLNLSKADKQRDAWRALRPHPGSTTLFLDGKIPVDLIANDLMRLWDFNPKSD